MTSRPDMERIVIAIDGSESSHEALRVGVELAAEQDTPVTIAHVVATPNGHDSVRPEDDGPLHEALEIARHAEVEPDLELLEGDAADEVAKLAERIDADLVIVGSRGLGRATASLLGSVSRAMLERCKRPVMIVRGHRTAS